MARKPLPITLNDEAKAQISDLCNNENVAKSVRARAKVIELAARDLSDEEIRNITGNKISTIREWRRAYIARGIDGISNKSGRYGTKFVATSYEQQVRMLQPGNFSHPYLIDESGNHMDLTLCRDCSSHSILIPQPEVLGSYGLVPNVTSNFQNNDCIPTLSVPSTLADCSMPTEYSLLNEETGKNNDIQSDKNCNNDKYVITISRQNATTGEIIATKSTSVLLNNKVNYESTLSCSSDFSKSHKILCDGVDSVCKEIMQDWSKSAFLDEHNEQDARTCIIETYRGRMNLTIPKELKSSLGSRGMMWDPSLLQNTMFQIGISSYREGVTSINNLLRRDKDEMIQYRTVHNKCVEEGKRINEYEEIFSKEVLTAYGFNPDTLELVDEKKLPDEVKYVKFDESNFEKTTDLALEFIQNYNDKCETKEQKIKENALFNNTPLYHPNDCVVVCLDIVFVSRQKSERKKDESDNNLLIDIRSESKNTNMGKKVKKGTKKERKNNPNIKKNQRAKKNQERKKLASAVATIATVEGSINIVADNMQKLLSVVLAIMLKYNILDNKYLIFFTDGEEAINSLIKQVFSFRKYAILLDWIHLQKKCYEYLTSIIKGGKKNYERNEEIRSYFYSILFAGNIDEAMKYLDNLDQDLINDKSKIEELKKYLEKKRQYIYPYAIRKGLHMVNSSNRVEKANDMIVSSRCKNNSTSWTQPGLNGMRDIRCIYYNNEEDLWFSEHTLSYKPHVLNENTMMKNAEWIDKHTSHIMVA